MAYNKEKIYNQAIEAITKNNLFFIEDIVAWLPISKATLYEFFPLESDELNNLKNLLNINKTKTKSAIRAKLFKSDKAGELLALYRLICDDEERQKLNQQYIEMRQKHDRELTPEEAKEFAIATLKELTKCDETE
jgi:hypothetical protein